METEPPIRYIFVHTDTNKLYLYLQLTYYYMNDCRSLIYHQIDVDRLISIKARRSLLEGEIIVKSCRTRWNLCGSAFQKGLACDSHVPNRAEKIVMKNWFKIFKLVHSLKRILITEHYRNNIQIFNKINLNNLKSA